MLALAALASQERPKEPRHVPVIENAKLDPRVREHPKREQLARYIGVPLFREDGSMFGTLCCYDSEPHAIDQATRDAVVAAARQIEPWLNELFAERS